MERPPRTPQPPARTRRQRTIRRRAESTVSGSLSPPLSFAARTLTRLGPQRRPPARVSENAQRPGTSTERMGQRRGQARRRRPGTSIEHGQIAEEAVMSTTVKSATEITPFHVEFPQEDLDDLHRRITATRWPSKELVGDRSQGVQLATVQRLARYWVTEYDWRRCEAKLNALPQFTTEIDGVVIHFIHVKSRHENALPLILTHGWPGSIIEMLEVVGPLTDPTAHGGSADDSFDLVVPSIPGYGFSPEPTERGWEAGRV